MVGRRRPFLKLPINIRQDRKVKILKISSKIKSYKTGIKPLFHESKSILTNSCTLLVNESVRGRIKEYE